jgi:hypothetical protein
MAPINEFMAQIPQVSDGAAKRSASEFQEDPEYGQRRSDVLSVLSGNRMHRQLLSGILRPHGRRVPRWLFDLSGDNA